METFKIDYVHSLSLSLSLSLTLLMEIDGSNGVDTDRLD